MRIVIAAFAIALSGCASPPVNRVSAAPLTVVPSVDLNRYLGRWYEIARYDNRFEKGCEGVTAEYAMRADGLISVANTCRDGSPSGKARQSEGRARVIDEVTNAKLKVNFFGPFWGDYWIIDLKEDYSRAIVSEPKGRYLWILSRTPTISDEDRAEADATLKALGFNVSALRDTRQPPDPDRPETD